MTPNDASSTIPGNPDSILELMKLPAFQNLLAKVETNFYRNRPKEAADQELEGQFDSHYRNARPRRGNPRQGTLDGPPEEQAQELISELVYPPLESDGKLILESDAKAPQLDFGIASDDQAKPATPKPILPPDPLRNSRNFRSATMSPRISPRAGQNPHSEQP